MVNGAIYDFTTSPGMAGSQELTEGNMLEELTVKNFALIEDIHISFDRGFNVFTGETGAGKSIIIGAVGFLLGERASGELVRKGSDECEVSGVFDMSGREDIKSVLLEDKTMDEGEEEILLKRTFGRDGRSRCFLNNRIITISILHRIGRWLVDIHGQHSHQMLLDPSAQRDVLDRFGNLENMKREILLSYNVFREQSERFARIREEEKERKRQIDLYGFQVDEINESRLSCEEEAELEKEHNILNNASQLSALAQEIYNNLYDREGSVSEEIELERKNLEKIASLDAGMKGVLDEFDKLKYGMEGILLAVREYRDKIESDPERLEEVIERLELIKKLKRKYGNTVKEILEYAKSTEAKLEKLKSEESCMRGLSEEVGKTREKLMRLARTLSEKRKKTGELLAGKVEEELKSVGMNKTRFSVNISETEINPAGIDEIEFLISPNVGEDSKPMARIASGGEMSRIMLALKTILARADRIPSLIFDEIDSGIGGGMAGVVGRKLKGLASEHQVICITHLPQIASFASTHFHVDKTVSAGRTKTTVEKLGKQDRIEEIARMLGGKTVTESTAKLAREMVSEKGAR